MKKIILALIGFFLLTPEILFCQTLQVRTAAITGDTAAYASGDLVGAKLSLTDPNSVAPITRGTITGIMIQDLAAQAGDLEVVFFNADPSGTTFTNNAALDIADADLAKVIGSYPVKTDYAFADNSIIMIDPYQLPMPFVLSGTTLYAAIIARAARTQATNTDLTLKVYIESR